MELVAAAKLRRVQEDAKMAQLYSDAAIGVLRRLSDSPEAARHPFFTPSKSKDKLYVIFTSDRGLAGAFNSNVFNAAVQSFAQDKQKGLSPSVIAIGRKGSRYFSRGSNIELVGAYENIADNADISVFAPVMDTLTNGIYEGKFGAVSMIFTESLSTMVQQVKVLDLIPVGQPEASESEKAPHGVVYEMEPDAQTVLDSALRIYFESSLRRAHLESAASEHSMRMISMGNASRNATDLIDSLTLELNATRQASITQAMAEIISGSDAIQ
jgi:F-type H+-transporting ATPase subunit gamma